MKKAVIFDMDGVIVDTGPIGLSVMKETVAPYIDTPLTKEEIEHYLGSPDRDFFVSLVKERGLSVTTEELLSTQITNYEAALEKGINENLEVCTLIKALAGNFILAINSGSTTHQIKFVLEKLELTDHFKCFVSCDDVTVGKPDPEGYVQALACCGVSPEEAIVIEDSPAGVVAASLAGIDVLQYGDDESRYHENAKLHTSNINEIRNYIWQNK